LGKDSVGPPVVSSPAEGELVRTANAAMTVSMTNAIPSGARNGTPALHDEPIDDAHHGDGGSSDVKPSRRGSFL